MKKDKQTKGGSVFGVKRNIFEIKSPVVGYSLCDNNFAATLNSSTNEKFSVYFSQDIIKAEHENGAVTFISGVRKHGLLTKSEGIFLQGSFEIDEHGDIMFNPFPIRLYRKDNIESEKYKQIVEVVETMNR
jgi:hypothetical protein